MQSRRFKNTLCSGASTVRTVMARLYDMGTILPFLSPQGLASPTWFLLIWSRATEAEPGSVRGVGNADFTDVFTPCSICKQNMKTNMLFC